MASTNSLRFAAGSDAMTATPATKEMFMPPEARSVSLPRLEDFGRVPSPAVAYREFRPLPALSDVVVCTWERTVPRSGPRPAAQRVLPDACVDFVWRRGELWSAGADTGAVMSPLTDGETITGIRLRPGAAVALLGVPAGEVRDVRVPVSAIWGGRGRELAGRLGEAGDSVTQRRLPDQAFLRARADAEARDALVMHALRRLAQRGSRVRALGAALGISERQL